MDTTCLICHSSRRIWRVRRRGMGITMSRYRSCVPPSTIWTARDSCWYGAFLRRVFWWRHCWTAAPTATWPKPRPQHSGLRQNQPARVRLRALLAQAHGDDAAYADFRDRYRDMAKTLGFEGHIAWADTMP